MTRPSLSSMRCAASALAFLCLTASAGAQTKLYVVSPTDDGAFLTGVAYGAYLDGVAGDFRYCWTEAMRQGSANTRTTPHITVRADVTLTQPLPPWKPNYPVDFTITSDGFRNLSGGNERRLFFFDAEYSVIRITNLGLINGTAQGGTGRDGGGGGAGLGGALFVAAGSVELGNVEFSGNRAIGGSVARGSSSLLVGGGGGLGGNGGWTAGEGGAGGGGYYGAGGASSYGGGGGGGGGVWTTGATASDQGGGGGGLTPAGVGSVRHAGAAGGSGGDAGNSFVDGLPAVGYGGGGGGGGIGSDNEPYGRGGSGGAGLPHGGGGGGAPPGSYTIYGGSGGNGGDYGGGGGGSGWSPSSGGNGGYGAAAGQRLVAVQRRQWRLRGRRRGRQRIRRPGRVWRRQRLLAIHYRRPSRLGFWRIHLRARIRDRHPARRHGGHRLGRIRWDRRIGRGRWRLPPQLGALTPSHRPPGAKHRRGHRGIGPDHHGRAGRKSRCPDRREHLQRPARDQERHRPPVRSRHQRRHRHSRAVRRRRYARPLRSPTQLPGSLPPGHRPHHELESQRAQRPHGRCALGQQHLQLAPGQHLQLRAARTPQNRPGPAQPDPQQHARIHAGAGRHARARRRRQHPRRRLHPRHARARKRGGGQRQHPERHRLRRRREDRCGPHRPGHLPQQLGRRHGLGRFLSADLRPALVQRRRGQPDRAFEICFGGRDTPTTVRVLSGGVAEFRGRVDLRSDYGRTLVDFTTEAGATLRVPAVITSSYGASPGSVGLRKLGAGTMYLSAPNTYTGGTIVSAGALVLDAALPPSVGAIRGAVTVESNAQLRATVTDAFGYRDGQKVDSITVRPAGVVSVAPNAGNQGWGVAYTLQDGVLSSNDGITSRTANSQFAFGGPAGVPSRVDVTGVGSAIRGRVDLRGDYGNPVAIFNVAAGAQFQVSAALTSSYVSAGFRKEGPGLMIVRAANNYTGPTEVAAGTLRVAVGATLGTGPVTVSPGASLIYETGSGPSLVAATDPSAARAFAGPLVVRGTLRGADQLADGLTVAASGVVIREGTGTTTLRGAVSNHGVLRFTAGAVLDAVGAASFVNHGVLDLLNAGPGTTLPQNFVNGPGGWVLMAESCRIAGIARRGAAVEVEIDGWQGHIYQLQSAVSLAGPFRDLGPAQAGAGWTSPVRLVLTDDAPEAHARFYRVVVH